MGNGRVWAGEMRDESSPLLSSSINEEYWSAPGGLVATAAVLIITSILFGAFGYSLRGIVACIPLYFVWGFRIFKKIFYFMWEFVVSLSRYSQSTQTECIEVGYNNCICSLAPTCWHNISFLLQQKSPGCGGRPLLIRRNPLRNFLNRYFCWCLPGDNSPYLLGSSLSNMENGGDLDMDIVINILSSAQPMPLILFTILRTLLWIQNRSILYVLCKLSRYPEFGDALKHSFHVICPLLVFCSGL